MFWLQQYESKEFPCVEELSFSAFLSQLFCFDFPISATILTAGVLKVGR